MIYGDVMNAKILKTLEFNKIIEKISEFALNDETKENIKNITFSVSFKEIKAELEKTDAAFVLMKKYSLPKFLRVNNIENSIKRVCAGGVLSIEEILNIKNVLKCAENLKFYYEEKDSILNNYFNDLFIDEFLRKKIEECILSEDKIADNASTELYNIRRKIRNESVKIKNQLNEMARSEKYKKFLQEQVVSIKNGRYVLPVKVEYKGEVPGIVHDVSASGGTLFIEPQFSVTSNNLLNELLIQEKREIEKILSEISQEIGAISEQLTENYSLILRIDFLFAKAKYADLINAVKPEINEEGKILIKNGRHPLIDSKKVVPSNITLGIDFDSLVVTGPNTGGKTVVLKTIGLFTIMTQAGILIPADNGTLISVFDNIFADIGDEQSIEQSLSTFSSHMKNITDILNKITPDSLVLFDELGAGTDPVEGAALACSILEYVRKLGAKTVATTHYSELKLYALSTERVENASCEFSVETLSPTYRLIIGIPGKSNAFEILKKLGFSEYIINSAKDRISENNIKFEDILTDIENDRKTAEESKITQKRLENEILALKEELQKEKQLFESKKEKIIEDANKKATKIFEDAYEETTKLILDTKTFIKNKEEKESLRLMEEVKKELGNKIKKTKSSVKPRIQNTKTNVNTLKPGASVLLVDLNDKGTVISINKKDETAVIQMGIMKTISKISNLVMLEDETKKNIEKFVSKKSADKQVKAVKTEIDLRGMMLEEAIMEVDNFLDRSIMAGLASVTIIHGKGTGILRGGIHEMLRKHPHVKGFRLGRYGEGENGVTIAELK